MNTTSNRIVTAEIISGTRIETLGEIADMKPQEGILRSDDCFFPVSAERLVIPSSGKLSPIVGMINMDTGYQVGQYMKGDSLIQNRDLVGEFEAKLLLAGYEFIASYNCFANGSRFEATYALTNVAINAVDGAGQVELKLRNSYDGKWALSLGRAVRRLICLNGMESLVSMLSLSKKHTSGLDLGAMAFNIETTIEGAQEEMKQFANMQKFNLTDSQRNNFLGNMVRFSKGGLSKTLATRMMVESDPTMADPTDPTDPTLWALYNVGTRVIRDLAAVRPDQAVKAGQAWSNICVLAANPTLSSYAARAFDDLTRLPSDAHRLTD
jgi:hypothetical protein